MLSSRPLSFGESCGFLICTQINEKPLSKGKLTPSKAFFFASKAMLLMGKGKVIQILEAANEY